MGDEFEDYGDFAPDEDATLENAYEPGAGGIFGTNGIGPVVDTPNYYETPDIGGETSGSTDFGDYDFSGIGEQPATGDTGNWRDIAKTLGLTDKNGALDWSKIIGLGTAGAALYSGATYKPPAVAPARDLLAGLPSYRPPAFTEAQMATFNRPMQAGNQLQRQYAADTQSPIRPGMRFADGGMVPDGEMGEGEMGEGEMPQGPLSQTAFEGYVQGNDGGQSDLVDAKLSAGEYVFDAETVAMLGDGNNAAGAKRLDELRQQLRAQKRAAPDGDIPEPAQGPLSYMKGGSTWR